MRAPVTQSVCGGRRVVGAASFGQLRFRQAGSTLQSVFDDLIDGKDGVVTEGFQFVLHGLYALVQLQADAAGDPTRISGR
jgi:hypothetical protein